MTAPGATTEPASLVEPPGAYPLTVSERIEARHQLAYALERCRALRNALEPQTGRLGPIPRRLFATDIERIVGPLIALQVQHEDRRSRVERHLRTTLRNAFQAGMTPRGILGMVNEVMQELTADPDGRDTRTSTESLTRLAAEHGPEPRQTCKACGTSVVVVQSGRGFPPDVAKRKLAKQCTAAGHTSDPQYTAGIVLGGPVTGQEG